MCLGSGAYSSSWIAVSDTSRAGAIGLVKDNPIVSMLDSLANFTFQGYPDFPAQRSALNKYNFSEDYVPVYSDSVYAGRMEKLNKLSPFEFIYNQAVRQYIDLYAVRKRGLTERVLGLAKIYFPLFEEQLDKYNIPLELKYLAVIESALNPVARSSAGAKGLWQFMYGTGKMYDLQVNSYMDDRSDPYKATAAACQHLKDLYGIYGDWALVLAAYNSGAGNVNKAIRRAGGIMDFWSIMRYLPKETRDYVPAFFAVNYVMSYSIEHNLYPVYPGIVAAEIDTVTIKNFLSFEQISEVFNIPMENIRYLNPAFSKDLIPASFDKPYVLRLPKQFIIDFINNEQAVYAYKTQRSLEKEKMMAMVRDMRDNSTLHIVKKGETLASIASRYNCSISEIKKWNNLKKGTVHYRQELLVYVKKKSPKPENTEVPDTATAKLDPSTEVDVAKTTDVDSTAVKVVTEAVSIAAPCLDTDRKSKFVYHVIRQGDTLWDIANKYNATVEQIKNLNNIKNANSLKPGQKIKVGTEG